MPNFWHHADDFKARHSQFLTCKRIGPTCNVAPVLKILGVPILPPGGCLGTAKQGTVPKIWRAVPIFLGRVNGVQTSVFFPPGQFKNCARWFMDDFNLSCSFCVVYLIMLIQGVGTLLPWNMFITAHAVSTQYFIVHVFVTTYYANTFGKTFV